MGLRGRVWRTVDLSLEGEDYVVSKAADNGRCLLRRVRKPGEAD